MSGWASATAAQPSASTNSSEREQPPRRPPALGGEPDEELEVRERHRVATAPPADEVREQQHRRDREQDEQQQGRAETHAGVHRTPSWTKALSAVDSVAPALTEAETLRAPARSCGS